MPAAKNKKIIIVICIGIIFIASVLMMRNTASKNLAEFNYEQEARLSSAYESMAIARDEFVSETNLDPVNDLEKYSNVKQEVTNNKFFKVRVGTYWIYEGSGVKLTDDNKISEYKIKIKNEAVAISSEDGDYLIVLKITDLVDGSVKNGEIILKKDYLLFNADLFNRYVRFPLKVGSRWSDDFDKNLETDKLRDDLFYQNTVSLKLDKNILGNECYNIIEQALSDKVEFIWCDNIGEIYSTYHHEGTLDDWRIKLIKYRY